MRETTCYIQKISKFILSNSAGTVVDTFILWILSRVVFYSYAGQYIISPALSFECAVFTNYLCSWHFIWRDRVKNYNQSRFWNKYLYYNLSSTGVFVIKMVFLLLFERFFGWQVVLCNLAALCISGIINFSMGEWIIFRKPKCKKHESSIGRA